MWLPNPIIWLRTSCLKPTITAMDMSITASPSAMPIMAIRTAGRDICWLSRSSRLKRFAMNSSNFAIFFLLFFFLTECTELTNIYRCAMVLSPTDNTDFIDFFFFII